MADIAQDVTEKSPQEIRTWCEFNYLSAKNTDVAAEFQEALNKAEVEPSLRYSQDGEVMGNISLPDTITITERQS